MVEEVDAVLCECGHEQVAVEIDGNTVMVDKTISDIVLKLSSWGFQVVAACEEDDDGNVSIEFKNIDAATRLVQVFFVEHFRWTGTGSMMETYYPFLTEIACQWRVNFKERSCVHKEHKYRPIDLGIIEHSVSLLFSRGYLDEFRKELNRELR